MADKKENNNLKISGGILGSTIGILITTMTYVQGQINNLESQMTKYIDSRFEHVIDSQDEILQQLNILDDRLYKIYSKERNR